MSSKKFAIPDPLDRALSYREQGNDRKDLDIIGFLPFNRGELGISGYHTHEVAHSCLEDTKLYRYKGVDLLRIPEKELAKWREHNKKKCESDLLMPKFSPTMVFGCLTCTHFTHSHKLGKDGNRTLFNEGKLQIFMHGDEARRIRDEGVCVQMFREELYYDEDARDALMNADNDDSQIGMAEDELQAQGRVEAAYTVVRTQKNIADITPADVMKEMKSVGLRTYSEDATSAFINFRLQITDGVCQCFRKCTFHSVAGRVIVNSSDYKLVAELDHRAMWLKTAILIRQYHDDVVCFIFPYV